MRILTGVICVALVGLALSSCVVRTNQVEAPQQPNVVVILLDDLGYSDIGAFGSEIETPAMDALAANGRSFSQFYVYPRCSPTRAALMTGMYPHQAGLGLLATPENAEMPAGPYQGYLDTNLPTLAENLRAVGYRTYMSGKWHLGESPDYWPRKFGFDRYFGLISGASSYYEIILDQPRERRMALDDAPWAPPETGFFMTDATTEFALEVLEEHRASMETDPFFLYVSYTAPHWPLHASEEDIDAYEGVYDGGWDLIAEARSNKLGSISAIKTADTVFAQRALGDWSEYDLKQDWIRNMQVHAAMVTNADRGIGEITEFLGSTGQLDNTIILVFSDNGASAEDVASRGLHDPSKRSGERGSYLSFGPKGAAVANTPLRDFKGSVYEGGVRSPLIVHWPDQIAGGTWDHSSVFGVMDLPSSILALSGALPPPEMEGKEFSGALIGAERASRPLYWEHIGWRGVRDGDLKAISAPGEAVWQLYDLSVDPGEANDLSADRMADVDRLAAEWQAWSDRVGAKPIPRETLMRLYGQQEK